MSTELSSFEKAITPKLLQQIPTDLWKPKNSLPFSQKQVVPILTPMNTLDCYDSNGHSVCNNKYACLFARCEYNSIFVSFSNLFSLSLYSLLGLFYWSFSCLMTASLLWHPLLFPELLAMLVYLAGSVRASEHLRCISLMLTVHGTVSNAEHCLQHPLQRSLPSLWGAPTD